MAPGRIGRPHSARIPRAVREGPTPGPSDYNRQHVAAISDSRWRSSPAYSIASGRPRGEHASRRLPGPGEYSPIPIMLGASRLAGMAGTPMGHGTHTSLVRESPLHRPPHRPHPIHTQSSLCMCVCVCACACVRVCVCDRLAQDHSTDGCFCAAQFISRPATAAVQRRARAGWIGSWPRSAQPLRRALACAGAGVLHGQVGAKERHAGGKHTRPCHICVCKWPHSHQASRDDRLVWQGGGAQQASRREPAGRLGPRPWRLQPLIRAARLPTILDWWQQALVGKIRFDRAWARRILHGRPREGGSLLGCDSPRCGDHGQELQDVGDDRWASVHSVTVRRVLTWSVWRAAWYHGWYALSSSRRPSRSDH